MLRAKPCHTSRRVKPIAGIPAARPSSGSRWIAVPFGAGAVALGAGEGEGDATVEEGGSGTGEGEVVAAGEG
jgi:hypothetical protein